MSERTLDQRRLASVERCLLALGDFWRADWSDFDGRTLRSQLWEVVAIGKSDQPERVASDFIDGLRESARLA